MKTYKEQFDKLTEAYINDEVNPYSPCACFVGNLLEQKGKSGNWTATRVLGKVLSPSLPIKECEVRESDYSRLPPFSREMAKERKREGISDIRESGYTTEEIWLLEREFMVGYTHNGGAYHLCRLASEGNRSKVHEDALFIAFDKTLDLLKEIHEAKGEVVDKPVFVRRVLQPA